MMRVLFLDVDGVLNNRKSMMAAYQDNLFSSDGKQFVMDPDTVALLEEIVTELDIHLVLSSVWRMQMIGLGVTQRVMRWAGWKGKRIPFHGVTDTKGPIRGNEIQRWLDSMAPYEDIEYVILDDSSDMLPSQMHRFVRTNTEVGLTREHVQQIRDLFIKEQT